MVVDGAALLVTAGGIVIAAAGVLVGRWHVGLATGVDLWVAAGLLRLGFDPGFDRILPAAAILGVRQLLSVGRKASEAA
jgi:hypothetical protein